MRMKKKIHVSLICLAAFTTAVRAQSLSLPTKSSIELTPVNLETKNSSVNIIPTEKALSQVVWMDDFSNPDVWIINNDGQVGPDFGWNIDSTVQSSNFAFDPIYFKGNFAELQNGQALANNQAFDVVYTLTLSDSLNLTDLAGTNKLYLSFLQYGARFEDAQTVEISTDHTNWVEVGSNADKTQLNSNNEDAYYPNPDTKKINLQPFLTGDLSSVWIRFKWTTASENVLDSNAWFAYGWMVDDVTISTFTDNDLVEEKVLFGTMGNFGTRNRLMAYYNVPKTQIQPIDFGAIVVNNGASTQNDIVFNAKSSEYTGASALTTLTTFEKDTLWVETPYTPLATAGTKTVTFDVSSGVADDVPSNNDTKVVAPFKFYVTDYIYARDNGAKKGIIGYNGGGFQTGPVFDIFADQTLYGIDVVLDEATTLETIIYGTVYEFQDNMFNGIAATDDFFVNTGMPGTKVTIQLPNPLPLYANSTYLVVVGTNGEEGKALSIGYAGPCDPSTAYSITSNGTNLVLNPLGAVPMVRMNFNPSVGLSEIENSIAMNIYPNPANTQANVSFSLKTESTVVISVSDLSGKTVYANDLGSISMGNHTSTIDTDKLSNGVYVVKFVTNGATSTQKLVVRK